jgi:hypothetical protein
MKTGAFTQLRGKRYISLKFLDDLLCYHETKSDSVDIHLLIIIDESEKLEKLALIILMNSNTGISDCYF